MDLPYPAQLLDEKGEWRHPWVEHYRDGVLSLTSINKRGKKNHDMTVNPAYPNQDRVLRSATHDLPFGISLQTFPDYIQAYVQRSEAKFAERHVMHEGRRISIAEQSGAAFGCAATFPVRGNKRYAVGTATLGDVVTYHLHIDLDHPEQCHIEVVSGTTHNTNDPEEWEGLREHWRQTGHVPDEKLLAEELQRPSAVRRAPPLRLNLTRTQGDGLTHTRKDLAKTNKTFKFPRQGVKHFVLVSSDGLNEGGVSDPHEVVKILQTCLEDIIEELYEQIPRAERDTEAFELRLQHEVLRGFEDFARDRGGCDDISMSMFPVHRGRYQMTGILDGHGKLAGGLVSQCAAEEFTAHMKRALAQLPEVSAGDRLVSPFPEFIITDRVQTLEAALAAAASPQPAALAKRCETALVMEDEVKPVEVARPATPVDQMMLEPPAQSPMRSRLKRTATIPIEDLKQQSLGLLELEEHTSPAIPASQEPYDFGEVATVKEVVKQHLKVRRHHSAGFFGPEPHKPSKDQVDPSTTVAKFEERNALRRLSRRSLSAVSA